jgi:hypothetical protein
MMPSHTNLLKIARVGPFTASPGERWINADLAEMRDTEILASLDALVVQFSGSAPVDNGQPALFDSMGISALADAMRILAANGWYRIVRESGRRVIAERVPKEKRAAFPIRPKERESENVR